MELKTVSLADRVYERLETDILSGKYKRGEALTELGLSAELQVSRTPIREALRRLQQDALVEEKGHGLVVLGITKQDIKDMYAVRLRIEDLAVRGFIENAGEEALQELREAVEYQEFYLAKQNPEKMRSGDGRFHDILYTHCGSAVLQAVLVPLHKKVQRYREISLSSSGRAVKSIEEHKAILAAIEAKDSPLAEKLILEHVENALESILAKEE